MRWQSNLSTDLVSNAVLNGHRAAVSAFGTSVLGAKSKTALQKSESFKIPPTVCNFACHDKQNLINKTYKQQLLL